MPRRKVDGVLLLDKSAGITSNQALQKAKRLFNAEKAGHTGTLDPFATGLLPLCFGEATKFSQFLLNADKVYLAEIRLGVRTSTADPEGDVIETRPVAVDATDIETVLPRFLGEIAQVPPMHSALKRDGRPLYEYARRGIDVPREPRQVQAGKVLDQVVGRPQSAVQAVLIESFQFGKGMRGGDGKGAHRLPTQGLQITATAQRRADILGQRAHIETFAAMYPEREPVVGQGEEALQPEALEGRLVLGQDTLG